MKDKRTVSVLIRDRESKKPIYEWDVAFTDNGGRGFRGPMFAVAMMRHVEERIKELLRVDVVCHKKGWRRKKWAVKKGKWMK